MEGTHSWLWCIVFLTCASIALTKAERYLNYVTVKCNGAITGSTGGQLESSTALTYTNDMNCQTKIVVSQGKRIYVRIERFEFEEKVNGNCVDYLNIYDGGSTGSSRINSEVLCGRKYTSWSFTSSGNTLLLHSVTDGNAVFRGFALIFTELNNAPCSGDQFACANNYCIDPLLECDDIDHCGDGTDESKCTPEDLKEKLNVIPIGLIIGLSVGFIVLVVIIAIIAYKVYQYYKWKKYLRDLGDNKETLHMEYPVTEEYAKNNPHRHLGYRVDDPHGYDNEVVIYGKTK